MTVEIIIFVAAVLFGILLYWRESKSNGLYRFFNKLTHTKRLQMKAEDRKGFLYQRPFLIRLVHVFVLFLLAFVLLKYVIPFEGVFGFQMFIASAVGTLVGTYVASAVILANKKVGENDTIVEDAIEKGKELIENLGVEKKVEVEETKPEPEALPKEEKKSARERLKDKGYLK